MVALRGAFWFLRLRLLRRRRRDDLFLRRAIYIINGEKNNNALSFRLQLLNLFYRYQLLD